jgi:hypothetical protein
MGSSRQLQRLVTVFRAFFDESGTDRKKNKAFVMGGFLGRVEEWLRASDAWELCLHEHPRIDYFKHSEYQSLDGQFVRFNRQRADEKILALAKTIGEFKLHGFCAVVPHGIIKTKPVKKGLIGSRVYDWGFAGAVKLVLQHMRSQPIHEKVDFVFDDRSELRANIDTFNAMKAQPMFGELMAHAGGCDPGVDTETVALQMADLLAAEFLIAGEEQIQSDAFQIIRDKNRIGYQRCDPPVQHVPTLDLLGFGAQLQREAGEFLKLDRDKLLTPEETFKRLADLLMKEAFFNGQHTRLLSFLENDPEYQDFRRKYLASTGFDPMSPTEDS